jgi:hypothetical protein
MSEKLHELGFPFIFIVFSAISNTHQVAIRIDAGQLESAFQGTDTHMFVIDDAL